MIMDFEWLTLQLASQEYLAVKYQENLYSLYLESVAQHFSSSALGSQQLFSWPDSKHPHEDPCDQLEPLDLSKNSNQIEVCHSGETQRGHVAAGQGRRSGAVHATRCPLCGKMFSRPWLLKGKLESS